MSEWIRFQAPKRRGIMLHISILFVLSLLISLMLIVASESPPGLLAVFLLIASVLLSLLLPVFSYRLYALLRSEYSLSRAGLRIRWGLRQIDLPHELILDVALAEELHSLPAAPRWSWPGSILGITEDEVLGPVEYIASRSEGMLLVGTVQRVYVISPEKPGDFLAVYHREAERGSLVELKASSVMPSFLLSQAWQELPVRRLLLAGAGLAVALLLLVGFIAPGLEGISLGFDSSGAPLEAVTGTQLFLLPALNLAFFFANLLLGLILYRESKNTLLARLVWGSSLLSGVLFLGAIAIISFS